MRSSSFILSLFSLSYFFLLDDDGSSLLCNGFTFSSSSSSSLETFTSKLPSSSELSIPLLSSLRSSNRVSSSSTTAIGGNNNNDETEKTDNSTTTTKNQKVYKGRVTFFVPTKGYGFIKRDDDDKDIFVHWSNINMDGFRKLIEDDPVQFDIGHNDKGIQAINVIVDEEAKVSIKELEKKEAMKSLSMNNSNNNNSIVIDIEPLVGKIITGRVKWFKTHLGYGYIEIEGITDQLVFVHQNDIIMDGFRKLRFEQLVEFTLENSDKGLRAVNVTPKKIESTTTTTTTISTTPRKKEEREDDDDSATTEKEEDSIRLQVQEQLQKEKATAEEEMAKKKSIKDKEESATGSITAKAAEEELANTLKAEADDKAVVNAKKEEKPWWQLW